jgi:hypothetical protein
LNVSIAKSEEKNRHYNDRFDRYLAKVRQLIVVWKFMEFPPSEIKAHKFERKEQIQWLARRIARTFGQNKNIWNIEKVYLWIRK